MLKSDKGQYFFGICLTEPFPNQGQNFDRLNGIIDGFQQLVKYDIAEVHYIFELDTHHPA